MARADFEAWIPEEFGSRILTKINQTSAVEALFRREPMSTDSKTVPRSHGMDVAVVAKGSAYGEDTSANDEVTLIARKFGRAMRIAEEDLADSPLAILATKRMDWATSYAKALDNAVIAVTGTENGTTVPFTSIYKALATTNSDTGYTAEDHILQTDGPVTYDSLSDVLGLYEESDFFDAGSTVVLAHPSFKKHLRGIKDDHGTPVFVQGQGGDSGTPDQLFDYPVRWTLGAKTHATVSSGPTGNPLLAVVNRDFMILGVRSGPESVFIDGRDGLSALTDEAILKMRARRGFVIGHEKAAAILEVTPEP